MRSARSALVVLLLATSAVAVAPAAVAAPDKAAAEGEKSEAAPPPRVPGPQDAKAVAILDRIVAGPDTAARKAAIDELMKVAPQAIDAIGEWLARPLRTSDEERRAVLDAIEAAVPDKSGRFAVKRQTRKERKADDDDDWMPRLLALDPAMPGVGEVIAGVAAIRALSSTKDIRAAKPIFDTAFRDETMIYRDECGRYLRTMEPYSVPFLTREAHTRGDRRRYANFQLERIDRQEPLKALGAAEGDEALLIAILETFRELKLREAVHAVWTKVNDDRPKVREAARAAWMDYITGPPPRPAPKKKLQMPGGKLTKKEKPLWLTYRELADNELRLVSNELLHTDYPLEDPMSLDDKEHPTNTVKIDLLEVTKQLFDHFDAERAKREAAQWAEAKAKADQGDLATATTMIDRMLAANPQRSERAGMASIYFAWGKHLEGKQQWADAAVAYSKAHGLDPKGARATDALAAHHYTLGKSLEAQGKDGGADYRRAVALKPDYAPAQTAVERVEGPSRPVWMLYAAVIAGALAALLFALAMKRRRQS